MSMALIECVGWMTQAGTNTEAQIQKHTQTRTDKESDVTISIHLCCIDECAQRSKDKANFGGNTRDNDEKNSRT